MNTPNCIELFSRVTTVPLSSEVVGLCHDLLSQGYRATN